MHAGTLSLHAQNALAKLGRSGILTSSYLAGGSALALHLGHRKSYDLDFYTRENLKAEDVASQISKIGKFEITLLEPPHTILGVFEGIKFSLFRYDYPLIGRITLFKSVAFVSREDIAAMKLSAITGRATKRDYIDLYFLAKLYSFDKMLKFYKKKFGKLGNNLYFIIKALGFFGDCENDEMPKMITPVSWEKVKDFFADQSMRLAHKYI